MDIMSGKDTINDLFCHSPNFSENFTIPSIP